MTKQKLTLRPKDYIVFNGGLKIENVGQDLITFEMPKSYSTVPFEEKLEKKG